MSSDVLNEVIGLLYGTEPISKSEPGQSDLATKGGMSDRKKRAITAGLSGVGATAGAAGLGLAAKETYHGMKKAPAGTKLGGRFMHAAKTKKLATALVPLEVAGLGGELMATKILHGDTKQKKPGTLVQKDLGDLVNQAKDMPRTKGEITQAVVSNPKVRGKGAEYKKKGAGFLKRLPTGKTGHTDVEKAAVTWEGEFAKVDDEKQQVFGWASVVEINGEAVLDLQGDDISVDEVEQAAEPYD